MTDLAIQKGIFPKTRWSLVSAVREGSPAALDELCRRYEKPIYRFICSQGCPAQDAQDLAQGFFAGFVMEKNGFALAKKEMGNLRAFLCRCLRNYLRGERDSRQTLKRGGGVSTVSLENLAEMEFENCFGADPSPAPDENFDRLWFSEIIQKAIAKLGAEQRNPEKWLLLKEFLPGKEGTMKIREAAEKLEAPLSSVTSDVTRLRERLRKKLTRLVYREIMRTVDSPIRAREEFAHLLQLFGINSLEEENDPSCRPTNARSAVTPRK